MASVKAKFQLKDADVERLKIAIQNCGEKSEEIINDFLHNIAGDKIADSVTQFLPVSNRRKKHAKHSKWHAQKNYNMSVGIENKAGFYYLYYVATATGTSKGKTPNQFMENGMDKVYDEIVDGLVKALDENIERELK